MKKFTWVFGRQYTGYRKMLLGEGILFKNTRHFLGWDAHLIEYNAGVGIPSHCDEITFCKHYRVNLVLRGDRDAFEGTNVFFNRFGLAIFRSDYPHSVRPVRKKRLVLSLGFARPNYVMEVTVAPASGAMMPEDWNKSIDYMLQQYGK